jgi:hypothetical protein
MASRSRRWYQRLCYNVGMDGLILSEAEVMNRYGMPRGFVRYWTEKARDPNFHSGELGGAHNCLFTEDAQILVEKTLWDCVRRDPFRTEVDYARELTNLGITVDDKYGVLSL